MTPRNPMRLLLAIPVYAIACLCGIVVAFAAITAVVAIAHDDGLRLILCAVTGLLAATLATGSAAIAQRIHGPH